MMLYKINSYNLIITFLQIISTFSISIKDFGAICNNNTKYSAYKNNIAIRDAILSNYSEIEIEDECNYYITSISIDNTQNKIIQLNGNITLYDDVDSWNSSDGRHYNNALQFTNCNNITIMGDGWIDGQGMIWWENALLNKLQYTRPNMLNMNNCENIVIYSINFMNSPQYHINMDSVRDVDISDVYIFVKDIGIPVFPLNTDGIDVAGQRISITNSYIRNFDDAIAIKPLNNGNTYNCSKDIIVSNIQTEFGVGMSIGSVSPDVNTNCVKNVVFRNVEMHNPIKSIYIKTNHGDNGYGVIDNITYENIVIHSPIWYNIYIGPQQEKEPNGEGEGCMLYPILSNCPTQPRVSINNIFLKNITTYSGILKVGGIIRCNETNPCSNIVFEDVMHYPYPTFYICENLQNYNIQNCLI